MRIVLTTKNVQCQFKLKHLYADRVIVCDKLTQCNAAGVKAAVCLSILTQTNSDLSAACLFSGGHYQTVSMDLYTWSTGCGCGGHAVYI